MKTISVKSTVWGNFKARIGTVTVKDFGTEFDAQWWLDEQLATGQYKLSTSSDLKAGTAYAECTGWEPVADTEAWKANDDALIAAHKAKR